MVLSSTGGRLGSMDGELGSTQVTATEDEILDNYAKEAHSEEGVDDVDQCLINDWWHASNEGNDNKKGYTRYLEGGKHLAQCRGGNEWTV